MGGNTIKTRRTTRGTFQVLWCRRSFLCLMHRLVDVAAAKSVDKRRYT